MIHLLQNLDLVLQHLEVRLLEITQLHSFYCVLQVVLNADRLVDFTAVTRTDLFSYIKLVISYDFLGLLEKEVFFLGSDLFID